MKASSFSFSNMTIADDKASGAHYANKDESIIWDEFLNGSDSALAYFYRIYAHKLFNYGRQIVPQNETVSDSIQDLFFELINKRKKLGKTTSIKNYLYASLRRRLIRHKEKNAKQISGEGKFEIGFFMDEHSPVDLFSSEQISIIEKACNELPERQREAILLLYYEELDYEEIAKIMNIGKIRSARALVYRAIDSLKTILDPIRNELLFLILILQLFLHSA